MPRIEPAVTTLWYTVADGVSYIDLAKDLSMVNRRLYRQGMVYAIQDVQVGLPSGMRSSDVFQATFSVIPNSWIAHNAWKKAFATWRSEQRKVTDVIGPIHGKWQDFKIYLDDSHEDGTTLGPVAGDSGAFSSGEWEHSKFVFDDDGTERELKMHMIGSSNLADANNESGIGLINEYQNSRANQDALQPLLPGGASETIYAKLMGTDDMSDMIVDNVEGDNDRSPYDPDDYPGGDTNGDAAQLVQIMSVSSQQSVGRAPGFVAPCGLVRIETNEIALNDVDPTAVNAAVYADGTAATALIGITVAVGPYRGVLATPMGQ